MGYFLLENSSMKKILLSVISIVSFLVGSTQASLAQKSAQEYINTYKEQAVNAMEEFGVPASIILAIAMHESANGTSRVATYLNNHFGIKGPNNSKQIRSSYKGYASVQESYDDFINYLKNRKQFQSLFTKYSPYDYQSWAYGIMKGGYAGSKAWASHIVATIKKHQLFLLDNRPEGHEDSTLANNEHLAEDIHIKSYTVKKGDSLGAIAKRHHTSVRKIKNDNKLKSDRLKIGQRIKI